MKRIIALLLFLTLISGVLFSALADDKKMTVRIPSSVQKAFSKLDKKALTLGDKGPLVISVKKRMRRLSYYSKTENLSEYFNNDMVTKVKDFQTRNRIKVTGKIDADCLKLLYSDRVVTATGLVLSDENNYEITRDYTLLGNEQFVAGKDGNIILIVLDTYSNSFFNDLLSESKGAAKGLEDFVYYDNYDCCFVGTYPSMVMMLTGYEYNNEVTIGQWFSDAWKSKRSKSFFKTLKEKGYESYFYSVAPVNCGLKSEALGLFKNYVKNSKYTGKVIKQKTSQNFYTAVKSGGVKTKPGKRFIIQHLHGLHTPYTVDEKGNAKKGASLSEAASGWITITKAYLEALKKAGVYDNSTIIITADHGPKNVKEIQPIFLIKLAGETGKKLKRTNAPVSHREFQATILHCAGVEKSALPSETIFDFEEDEERERTVYINRKNKQLSLKPKYNGYGWGSHNVWEGYTYTGDSSDLVKEAKRHGPTKHIEMKNSFN